MTPACIDPFSSDEVAEATRAISAGLDASDAMGEAPYVLEVGSPGVDRPLTAPRHFRHNVTRLVEVSRHSGDVLTGRLVGAGPTHVRVLVAGDQERTRDRAAHPVCRHRARPGAGRVCPPHHAGGQLMDIDLAALKGLGARADISLNIIIPAIEQAMLVAYHRTDGARRIARVELDRKTGHVTVWAREEGVTDPETGGALRAPAPSSTTLRPASGGSRPRRHARSSCSGCETSRTKRSWATSTAARATSSPASSSRAAIRAT